MLKHAGLASLLRGLNASSAGKRVLTGAMLGAVPAAASNAYAGFKRDGLSEAWKEGLAGGAGGAVFGGSLGGFGGKKLYDKGQRLYKKVI